MRRNRFLAAVSSAFAFFCLPLALTASASAASGKIIYSFQGGRDGAYPYSDLVVDAAGNLYGTTSQGGVGCDGQGCGTVFELVRTNGGWKHQVLYSFAGGSDGSSPMAGLVFDGAGNLYGTTSSTVFELSPNGHGSWIESVIYTFTGGADGSNPMADLVFDGQGNIYGTDTQGGQYCSGKFGNGCGAVFELTPQAGGSWLESTLHTFAGGQDGAVPSSGVLLDASGNVYGMTLYGGTGSCFVGDVWVSFDGCGTTYQLSPESGGTWTETILYNFVRGGGFGLGPSGGLLFDRAGHLYGTSQGGGDGYGTFFELRDSQKNGWQQGDLHFFYGNPDGQAPVGRLLVDAGRSVFGVTQDGGANGTGVVFELRRGKHRWNERILYDFPSTSYSISPQAGLVLDSHDRLYGTTQYGGSGTACYAGCGTVYEVTP
jgi:uncharacterized repeat protein (TIGR03803 family)